MQKLRITGGYLKGRSIMTVREGPARYTSSKVRGAIFNLIGDVEGKRILDLYAGSGSFSVEALSRGAADTTCVENSGKMVKLLQENMASLSINNHCQVLSMDVRYAIPFLHGKKSFYDIIFMDPPYGKGYIEETMRLLQSYEIHTRDAMILLEYSKRESLNPLYKDGWTGVTTRRYGDTVVAILETA